MSKQHTGPTTWHNWYIPYSSSPISPSRTLKPYRTVQPYVTGLDYEPYWIPSYIDVVSAGGTPFLQALSGKPTSTCTKSLFDGRETKLRRHLTGILNYVGSTTLFDAWETTIPVKVQIVSFKISVQTCLAAGVFLFLTGLSCKYSWYICVFQYGIPTNIKFVRSLCLLNIKRQWKPTYSPA